MIPYAVPGELIASWNAWNDFWDTWNSWIAFWENALNVGTALDAVDAILDIYATAMIALIARGIEI